MTAPPRATARPVRWRYHFTDFRRGTLLATLPMTGVKLNTVLSGASSAEGTVPLSAAVRARDPFIATVPRRSCLWAERQELDPVTGQVADSRVMWGGVVMARARSLTSRAMRLTAVSWESYLLRRLTPDHTFTQVDKFTIMRTLVQDAVQQLPIPVTTPVIPARTYPPVTYGTVPQTQWNALLAAGWTGRAGDSAERIYHPLAPASPAPVTLGSVSTAAWNALRAAGWRGRPNDSVERLYPPPSLMTYTAPAIPGETYYAPSPYPDTSPHHFLLDDTGGALSGVKADRTYRATDLKPVLDSCRELASSGDGFDWRITPVMLAPGDMTTLRLRLDLGYPRLGRTAPADLRWSTDPADSRTRWGYIEDLTIAEDGSGVHNRVTALGEGTGPNQIRWTADSAGTFRDEFASGYPLYETSLQSSTQDLRTLDSVRGHAVGALLGQLASETSVSGIKIRGDLAPTLTAWDVGDDATLRIGEAATGQPTTIVGQIIGRTIEPAGQGSTEKVTIDVQGQAS